MVQKKETKEEVMARDGWVPASKAAEIMLVNHSTVHRAVTGKKLLGTYIGRLLYVSVASMLEYSKGSPTITARVKACGVKVPRG